MIDHVTYEVLNLLDPDLTLFFSALGMDEVSPAEHIAANYNVRWWKDPETGFTVHLVAQDVPQATFIGLGHFCITGVDEEDFDRLAHSAWLEHDSGSGRIWLEGPQGLRVEVHP